LNLSNPPSVTSNASHTRVAAITRLVKNCASERVPGIVLKIYSNFEKNFRWSNHSRTDVGADFNNIALRAL
jgi:hypothetical protein